MTVTAHDAYGNVATGYTGTVSLTSSDPHAVLPPTYTFTSYDQGTHTFSVTLQTAGIQSITATETANASITGNESGIAVRPDPQTGDADFTGAQPVAHSETVAQTDTEVVVVQNPVIENKKRTSIRPKSVRLTLDIKPSAPGGGVPTGEVTFELLKKTKKKVKVTTLGKTPVSGGEATLTLSGSKVLKKAIRIVYSGDADNKSSTVTTPKLT